MVGRRQIQEELVQLLREEVHETTAPGFKTPSTSILASTTRNEEMRCCETPARNIPGLDINTSYEQRCRLHLEQRQPVPKQTLPWRVTMWKPTGVGTARCPPGS